MEFNQEFIKEEIRDGWKVDTNMKKVWFVQLDLLKEFDRICRKYRLTWYPIFGTLLGVVRHHGYIPWDDDVDVAMPRKDWDKFVSICDKELKYPYFLQTTLNEEQCYMMWVSLRNSDTTGNRKTCMSKKQNNGIAIDIMPLDGCPANGTLYRINRFPLRVSTVLINTYVNDFNTSRVALILRSILRKFKIDYKKVYNRAERSNRKYMWDKYDYVTFRALADPLTKKIHRVMWHKEDFEKTVDMPFENITIPVPVGYDRILTQLYGNYMEFPPMDKRQGKHDMVYVPDVPYKEYCAKNYGVSYD